MPQTPEQHVLSPLAPDAPGCRVIRCSGSASKQGRRPFFFCSRPVPGEFLQAPLGLASPGESSSIRAAPAGVAMQLARVFPGNFTMLRARLESMVGEMAVLCVSAAPALMRQGDGPRRSQHRPSRWEQGSGQQQTLDPTQVVAGATLELQLLRSGSIFRLPMGWLEVI